MADLASYVAFRRQGVSDQLKPAVRPLVAPARPHLLRGVQVAGDLVAVALAMTLAFVIKVQLPGPDPSPAVATHILLGALSLPAWAAMFARNRLYSEAHTAARLEELRRLINATLLSLGILAAAGFVLKVDASRGWLVLSAGLAVLFVLPERSLIRLSVARLRDHGHLTEPVLIVGANVEGLALATSFMQRPPLGYRAAGFVDDERPVGSRVLGDVTVLGSLDQTLEVAERVGARRLVVATSAIDHKTSSDLIRRVTRAGLAVELSSSLSDISSSRLVVRPLGPLQCIYVEPVRGGRSQDLAKRAFDVFVAAAVGLLVLPLLLFVALAIKFDSSGTVLFRQNRIGKNGRLFSMLKFRTMVSGAERARPDLLGHNEADGPLFKLRNDPRCTRVGRILRAFSVDELPQLWNVIRGDMSLVGPRPALPEEAPLWTPELHQRLRVKPGITGMWQVSGRRRWVSFEDYIRLDLYYVDNWSLWTDLAILFKSVPIVLFRRGAA